MTLQAIDHVQVAIPAGGEDKALPGHERVFIFDPFGNRLEFLKPLEGGR